MKQLLELVQLDDGTLDLRCCDEKLINNVIPNSPKKFDKVLKGLIRKIVKILWGDKNTGISKLIRTLSMAEICACAEPYSHAEEFWSTMMFSLIPRIENYARDEKRKYAYYDGARQRPITCGDWSAFQIDPFRMKMN